MAEKEDDGRETIRLGLGARRSGPQSRVPIVPESASSPGFLLTPLGPRRQADVRQSELLAEQGHL
jgi:hypothetical protein